MNWFVVLAPLLLLPIVFLFAFVGCLDGEESLGSVTGWDQGVILEWNGLPANAERLTFSCHIATKSEGVSEWRNSATTPPLAPTDSPAIKLLVAHADEINGLFHCTASCELVAKDGAGADLDLMDPDPARRTITKNFPPGITEWHFGLVPLIGAAGEVPALLVTGG
jgi:hypothetical protein